MSLVRTWPGFTDSLHLKYRLFHADRCGCEILCRSAHACAVTIFPEAAMTSTEVSADLAALVRSAQAGDRAALGALIAALRPPVFRYVLSRVGDRNHADDVTQEVAM